VYRQTFGDTVAVAVHWCDKKLFSAHVVTVLLIRPGAAPGPGGPPQPAQQSKRLQQTQAQVDEVLDASTLLTIISTLVSWYWQ